MYDEEFGMTTSILQTKKDILLNLIPFYPIIYIINCIKKFFKNFKSYFKNFK